jgi:hypothetical protein
MATTPARPAGARGPETSDNLKEAVFGSQFVEYQKEVIIADYTQDILPDGGTMDSSAGNDYAEMSSSHIMGVEIANAEHLGVMFSIPAELDMTKDLEFGILGSNSEAVDATKYSTIVTLYKSIKCDGTAAIALADTAVTSEMGLFYNVGAGYMQKSSTFAKIAGATLAATGLTPGRDIMSLLFTNTITGAADFTCYRIFARYYRRSIG